MIPREIFLCFALILIGHAEAAPAPKAPSLPCKSPTELAQAVDYALSNQDTNFFWKLCYWKYVPADYESRSRLITLIHFKAADDLTKIYSRFQLLPAPPDANTPRPKNARTNRVQRIPNLPVVGLIGYRTRGTARGLTAEPIRYTAGGDMEYGRAPDGTYWLTIDVPLDARPKGAELDTPAGVSREIIDVPSLVPPQRAASAKSAPVSLEPAITNDPQKTLQTYFAAISKGDRETAMHLTARFPKVPEADVGDKIDGYIEFHQNRKSSPEIKGSKIMENCAVVVVLDSPTDPARCICSNEKRVGA